MLNNIVKWYLLYTFTFVNIIMSMRFQSYVSADIIIVQKQLHKFYQLQHYVVIFHLIIIYPCMPDIYTISDTRLSISVLRKAKW